MRLQSFSSQYECAINVFSVMDSGEEKLFAVRYKKLNASFVWNIKKQDVAIVIRCL